MLVLAALGSRVRGLRLAATEVEFSQWRVGMSAELQFLEAWIPEKMEPGTVFLLEGPNSLGHGGNPFVAVLACPGCGTVGLITRRQLHGFETMICGGEQCSAEFGFDGDNIRYRAVQ